MSTRKTKKKILIVDDELYILMALEFLFEQQGYEVKKAMNGAEAIEVLENFKADVMILDVMMPVMDGFECAIKIRSDEKFYKMPIFFLTAKGENQDRAKAYASGAEFFITKPFENEELIRMVNETVLIQHLK